MKLVLEPEPLVMEPEADLERVRQIAEVAVLDSGLAQVPGLGRRMVEVLLGQRQGQGRVRKLERVEVKRLARMGATTR